MIKVKIFKKDDLCLGFKI
ncbi:MAG: ribosomal-processing cysteine protease Prp, partial [Clostridium sp.]|nr:ribosomal-processing cysteine protease Prp [Clostridium sp.]